jgi:hypothetical protein
LRPNGNQHVEIGPSFLRRKIPAREVRRRFRRAKNVRDRLRTFATPVSRRPITLRAAAENDRGPTADTYRGTSGDPIAVPASADNVRARLRTSATAPRAARPPPIHEWRASEEPRDQRRAVPDCKQGLNARSRASGPPAIRGESLSRHGLDPDVARKTSGPFRAGAPATQQVFKEQAPARRQAPRTRTELRGATTDAERSFTDLACSIANARRRYRRFRARRGFGSTTLLARPPRTMNVTASWRHHPSWNDGHGHGRAAGQRLQGAPEFLKSETSSLVLASSLTPGSPRPANL